jgi:hypothetical protein
MSARVIASVIAKLGLAFVIAVVVYFAVLFLAVISGATESSESSLLGDLWSGDWPYFFFAGCFLAAAALVWGVPAAWRRHKSSPGRGRLGD